MSNKYRVVAKVYKPWFKKPRLRYHVIETYSYWHDPSYGNGGGDYKEGQRAIAVLENKHEASCLAHDLNFYK